MVAPEEASDMKHAEFAERVARRLEAVAYSTEDEARRLGIAGEASGTRARAQGTRVAAFLVREEALAVSKAEAPAAGSPAALAEAPPLEAQG
jgi:hypothetical protein